MICISGGGEHTIACWGDGIWGGVGRTNRMKEWGEVEDKIVR